MSQAGIDMIKPRIKNLYRSARDPGALEKMDCVVIAADLLMQINAARTRVFRIYGCPGALITIRLARG